MLGIDHRGSAPTSRRRTCIAVIEDGLVLAAYVWADHRLPEIEARAPAFATLVVGNLALILLNRSVTKPICVTLRTPNLTLRIVVGLTLALLLCALHVPWAVSMLRFAPLPPHELAAAASLGLVSVL